MNKLIETWQESIDALQRGIDEFNIEIAATRLKLSNMENVVNHAQIN